MNKIRTILFDVYKSEINENIEELSEEQVNELIGTLLGLTAAKAAAPLLGALGAKLGAVGAVKAGATALMAGKAAGVVGGLVGAATDVAIGKKILNAVKGSSMKTKDSEPEQEFRLKVEVKKDANGKVIYEYPIFKASTLKDAIEKAKTKFKVSSQKIMELPKPRHA